VFRRKISTGELRETAAASRWTIRVPGLAAMAVTVTEKERRKSARSTPMNPMEGGFDAVIGNRRMLRQGIASDSKEYFQKHYDAFDARPDL